MTKYGVMDHYRGMIVPRDHEWDRAGRDGITTEWSPMDHEPEFVWVSRSARSRPHWRKLPTK